MYIDNQSIGKDVWFDNLVVDNYTSSVVEEDHYYPFGLTLQTSPLTMGVTEQPYKLTTKELEKNFDLNMYDFGARQFDMQRGQWTTMDPLAEKYYNMSPYNFCGNNPVLFVDPNGMQIGVGKEYFDRFQREATSERNSATKKANKFDDLAKEAKANGDDEKANKYTEKANSAREEAGLFQKTLDELQQLDKSDFTYDIFIWQGEGQNEEGGKTFYNTESGHVSIGLDGGLYNTAKIAHEFKHLFQFDNGEISFRSDTGTPGLLFDLTDEVSAYERGALFGGVYKNADEILKNKQNSTLTPINRAYNNTGEYGGKRTFLDFMLKSNANPDAKFLHIYHIPQKQN